MNNSQDVLKLVKLYRSKVLIKENLNTAPLTYFFISQGNDGRIKSRIGENEVEILGATWNEFTEGQQHRIKNIDGVECYAIDEIVIGRGSDPQQTETVFNLVLDDSDKLDLFS